MGEEEMKRRVGILCIIVVCVIVIPLIAFGRYYSTSKAQENEIKEENRLSFLKIVDSVVVNEEGEQVLLEGVNLGGWLIQENWMCPIQSETAEWANLNTLEVLEERFSIEEAMRLIEIYQDNWISEWDIRNIASNGCNVIRVPFWYRNFMLDEEGTWIDEDFDENPGFQKLDWVIETAGKYGIYVILDMHGCPGGQSMNHSSGTIGKNDLYTSEQCQMAMKKLWVAIAERYADNPTVAAYDVMNEAQNNAGYQGEHAYDPWQEKSWTLSNEIYEEMIEAIRGVDTKHIITIEGIWSIHNLPDPREKGWENMMYQVHLYGDSNLEQLCQDLLNTVTEYGAALYIGEFSDLSLIDICRSYRINYTSWTYKGTGGTEGTWFWYRGEVAAVDIQNDSYATIKKKWGRALRTQSFEKETDVISAFTGEEISE